MLANIAVRWAAVRLSFLRATPWRMTEGPDRSF
jgi:hypothetical protein